MKGKKKTRSYQMKRNVVLKSEKHKDEEHLNQIVYLIKE